MQSDEMKKHVRRHIGRLFHRGITGPYTKRSFHYLTPQEIEVACDGDKATKFMRDSILIHPDGSLSTMMPDIGQRPRDRLKRLKATLNGICRTGKEILTWQG